jgi:tRNA (guanine-N7-)-methyltransferase
MPHILIPNDSKLLETPSQTNGVSFNFEAESLFNQDTKISVTSQDQTFLLTKKVKSDGTLIKFDKATRVTPISIVKEAINTYATQTNAEVLFSNINHNDKKVTPKKEYLKDINYFVNDFKTNKEIWVEIGFGSGRHILHQAAQNPDVQLIGLEIHTPSIEQMLKQAKLQGIDNVLAVNYDARLFMEFLKSNSVGKIFVHFPVPWDKKPHRRIYSHKFIQEALRVLKIDGSLELRTDSENYYEFCSELLSHYPNVDIKKNQELEVSSKYEDRWKKQGKNIYDLTLVAKEQSEDKNLDFDFGFDKEIDFRNLKSTLNRDSQIKKDFFVHFEDILTIKDDPSSGLIALTFGSFNAPVTKYIEVKNNKLSYFQGAPIPTTANNNAHQLIKKMLG